ncbi:Hypothetical predicted protein, partial [Olea europaea subsp. europaea]
VNMMSDTSSFTPLSFPIYNRVPINCKRKRAVPPSNSYQISKRLGKKKMSSFDVKLVVLSLNLLFVTLLKAPPKAYVTIIGVSELALLSGEVTDKL